MKKKQKWELLKYAYDNYPKGTVFKWTDEGNNIVSTGAFKIDYGNSKSISLTDHEKEIGYLVFDGIEWAEIVTVDRKFAIKSVDGIDLYYGDTVHRSYWDSFEKQWEYDMVTLRNDRNAVITGVDKAKAFSTKEAAEAWILKMNKPNEIEIYQKSRHVGLVTKDGFYYKGDKSDFIPTEMIHDIYKASQKLNS